MIVTSDSFSRRSSTSLAPQARDQTKRSLAWWRHNFFWSFVNRLFSSWWAMAIEIWFHVVYGGRFALRLVQGFSSLSMRSLMYLFRKRFISFSFSMKFGNFSSRNTFLMSTRWFRSPLCVNFCFAVRSRYCQAANISNLDQFSISTSIRFAKVRIFFLTRIADWKPFELALYCSKSSFDFITSSELRFKNGRWR